MSVALKKYKLGNLMDVTRGASLAGEHYATVGDLVRLTLGNFDYDNCGFKENTSKDNIYYIGDVNESFILNEGDVITPLTEQTPGLLGTTARIPESGKYIQSQDVALIKCNPDLLDQDFAYYLLPSKIVKEQLAARAQQTKIRHTSPDKIKDCTVFVPSVEEQKKIAAVLCSIDDRINICRKICNQLEYIARSLYDFYFNNTQVPQTDWRKSIVEDEFDVLFGFPFSTELFTEEVTDKPVIRIRDILTRTISAYSKEDVDIKYLLEESDLLIGMDGNFHMNLWDGKKAFLNQRSARVRQKNDITTKHLLYQIYPYIKAKEAQAKGSTVGHLSNDEIRQLPITIPPIDILQEFNSKIVPLVKQQLHTSRSIEELLELRNWILPILMNGQMSIN